MSKQQNRHSTRKPKSSRARNRRLAQKQAYALNFETLEARQMLASVTVGNATDVLSPTANTSSITALLAADGGDGISLREAITAANNTAGADTITFDASVFTGGASSLIRLTQGELVITDTLTIDASSATDVTITGDADDDDITLPGTFITDVAASFGGTAGAANDLLDDNSRVLNFSSSSGDLTLNHLTLTGGRTTSNSAAGGGIRTNSGSVSLTSSTVSGNSTTGDYAAGGGIRTYSGSVSLTRSTVSGNSTTGKEAFGGGIRTVSGSVFLTRSTVSGNSTSGYRADGGGIYTNSGSVSLTSSTVSGNSTTGYNADGGGIGSFLGSVSLTSSTVSGNSTAGYGADGGGIRTFLGSLSLTRSTVSGNSTKGYFAFGGGIRTSSGSLSLTSSTVSGNSAMGFSAFGGGIFTGSGRVSLTSSTVSQNEAAGEGGGVFKNNSFSDTSFTINNSIVAGNLHDVTAPGIGVPNDLVPNGGGMTINLSLIGVADGLNITGDVGNLTGSAATPLDPQLGPLANNGGPTQTHALLPDSLALNMGSSTETVDQRGFQRDFNGVDIGAFERQLIEPVASPPVVTSFTRDEGGVLDRHDLLSTISVSFDVDVNVSAEDLIVRNDTTLGTVVDTSGIGFTYDMPTQTATWDFSSLPDLDAAFYSFELSDDIVSAMGNLSLDGDADGNPGVGYIESVYVAIPGDLNLDGDVDVSQIVFGPGGVQNVGDASILLANLGTTTGATYYQGDLNGDGDVDVAQIVFGPGGVQNVGDASMLLANLGRNVVPPANFSSTAATAISVRAASTNVPPQIVDEAVENLQGDEELRHVSNESESTLILAGDQALDEVFAESFRLTDANHNHSSDAESNARPTNDELWADQLDLLTL